MVLGSSWDPDLPRSNHFHQDGPHDWAFETTTVTGHF